MFLIDTAELSDTLQDTRYRIVYILQDTDGGYRLLTLVQSAEYTVTNLVELLGFIVVEFHL